MAEVHKIPLISTAHITEEVAELLNGDNPPVICAKWEHGWFLFLDVVNDDSHTWPACLRDIGWRLRVMEAAGLVDNSRWVRLDSDAEKDNLLPAYEW